MITLIEIDKQSPFLGEECALCKELLSPGDEAVICPEDGTRHHARCWEANDNQCVGYGCSGTGTIATEDATLEPDSVIGTNRPPRFRRPRIIEHVDGVDESTTVRPPRVTTWAQACLLLSIAVAIILFSIGCFGLWAIADYIMMEVLGWNYRPPLSDVSAFWPIVRTLPLLLL